MWIVIRARSADQPDVASPKIPSHKLFFFRGNYKCDTL